MDTRDVIVAAADRLFYELGIQRVGMDDIRSEAGVPLKRLYSEFAGKDEILLAVLDHRHTMWVDGVTRASTPFDDPRDRLLAIFDFLAEWFVTDDFRGCAFINAFGELGGSAPEVAAAARAHKQSFQAYVDDLVAQTGAARDLSSQLVLLAEGAQTTSAITGDPDTARHARAAAETLITAAGVPA